MILNLADLTVTCVYRHSKLGKSKIVMQHAIFVKAFSLLIKSTNDELCMTYDLFLFNRVEFVFFSFLRQCLPTYSRIQLHA